MVHSNSWYKWLCSRMTDFEIAFPVKVIKHGVDGALCIQ